MIPISVIFDEESITDIVSNHINKKTADLINWYTALRRPSYYLPDGFSEEESENVIRLLLEMIQSKEMKELYDYRMQFALSCILEEEERITDETQELSAEFSNNERKDLEKYLPEEAIEYYENYDHFRDLLLPDSSFLVDAMNNGTAHA